jgi:hypothetical protein
MLKQLPFVEYASLFQAGGDRSTVVTNASLFLDDTGQDVALTLGRSTCPKYQASETDAYSGLGMSALSEEGGSVRK